MLKDSLPLFQPPFSSALNVSSNHEVNKILSFIDNAIASFFPYYQSIKDSDRENRISDFLVHHFQICKLDEAEGFFPYDFRKNPTQAQSGKETDIGVFILTRSTRPISIIEFEAKRLSDSSNNKEYVCGERGGIERFKRGHHSSHLTVCGMFGYVQSRSSQEWVKKVNSWIEELSKNNSDSTINWKDENEKLLEITVLPKIKKLSSKHSRQTTNDIILLWHYFIELN